MHDLGGLIWVVVVLIGVISSIRKNAKNARKARVAAPSARSVRPAVATPAPPPVAVPPPIIYHPKPATPMGYVLPPVVAPEPPPAPALAATLAVLPLAPAPRVGTSPIRGMFEGPATLVRAIVAAEVLGPPKSLQEQSIWTPRHSEPSI